MHSAALSQFRTVVVLGSGERTHTIDFLLVRRSILSVCIKFQSQNVTVTPTVKVKPAVKVNTRLNRANLDKTGRNRQTHTHTLGHIP